LIQLATQSWRGNRLLGWFFLSSRSYSCRFALTHIYSPGLTGSDTSVEYSLQSFPGKRPETAASESLAEVAELADAHGSGPCARKGVGVRVPSSAPSFWSLRSQTAGELCKGERFQSSTHGRRGARVGVAGFGSQMGSSCARKPLKVFVSINNGGAG